MKKELKIRIDELLYEQIIILSKKYGKSINKTVIDLLEKGYLKIIGDEYDGR